MQIICTIFLIIRSETVFIRSAVPIKIVIKRRAKQLEGVAREQKTLPPFWWMPRSVKKKPKRSKAVVMSALALALP